MMMKIGRYISVIMLLAVFLTANALQYTHDITHDHDCSAADHPGHEHPEADECALCWFVCHQISSPFFFNSLLPEIAIQEYNSPLNELYRLSCQDGIQRSLGNKDPPLQV